MSRATEEALREAIIAHARDTAGGDAVPEPWLLGDWVVATQWLDPADDDGLASYMRISPAPQLYHRTVGLLHNALEDGMMVNLKRRDSE